MKVSGLPGCFSINFPDRYDTSNAGQARFRGVKITQPAYVVALGIYPGFNATLVTVHRLERHGSVMFTLFKPQSHILMKTTL